MPTIIIAAGSLVLVAAGVLALTPVVDAHRYRVLGRTVAAVARVFEAAAIDYWCDFGTLLGYYRDHDLIRGDKDADFGIVASEKPRILTLAETLLQQGYVLTDRGGRYGNVLRISDARTGYHLDIYEYVREGDVLRSVIASPEEDLAAALVTNRVRAAFLGATILVPADVPALLLHRYGPRFTIPRRGDKGATRPYSRVRSTVEDLQDNCLGLWALLRSAVSRRAKSPTRRRSTTLEPGTRT